MGADREQLLTQIDAATEGLLRTVRGFSDVDVRAPSLLPGWTRAHVLAHLVGGAGALRNLLDSARTGVALAAYASQSARDEAIEAGSRQDAATLLGEIAASAGQFRAAVTAMPEAAWERHVRTPTGAEIPAAQLLERRLVELELHHTDLDAGYGAGTGRGRSWRWTWPSRCAVSGPSGPAGGRARDAPTRPRGGAAIAVRAQLLDARRPGDLLEVVCGLTFLQLDPTAAIAPSADLVAWTRLGAGYQPRT